MLSHPKNRLASLMDLDEAIGNLRNMAWVMDLIEREYMGTVSREKPGKHLMEVDEVASEVFTWSMHETVRMTEALFEAFHAATAIQP